MFKNCSNLVEIKINTNFNNIENMQDMFNGCTSLSVLPDTFYIYGLANNIFYGCTSLIHIKNIIINATISNYIFNGCTSLETIESFIVNNSTSLISAFHNCGKLNTVNNLQIIPTQEIILQDMFSGCTNLISLSGTISNAINMKNMLYDCISLTTIDLSN